MGVYIKGIEMPKEDTLMILSPDGTVTFMDHETAVAVEIHEPHGRLIDADAVFDNLERTGWYDNADRDIAEDLVLDAPTFIPASGEET